MLALDPFMSNLYSQPVYSTEKFQTLQLIVLVVFGAMELHIAYFMSVRFL